MLKKKLRLKNHKHFQRAYRFGRMQSASGFSVHILKNHRDHNRLAIVVSTKVSKKAVVRNRIRRRLNGQFKEVWKNLQPGFDIVVTVKSDISKLPVNQLRANLKSCLNGLGVLN